MNHNGTWDERQWERVEEEYQEPAREVVRVMHWDMQVPLCHVAAALYVSEKTLRKWCRMWDLPTRKAGYIKTAVPGKVQLRARLLGYGSVAQAASSMRVEGLRWEDIQMRLKCSSSTLSRYLPANVHGYYNLTDAGREVNRAVAYRLNTVNRSGNMPDLALIQPCGEIR